MPFAIYPGSFDPLTNGHLDLIRRGCELFEGLTVAVLQNGQKQPLFTVTERVEMLREATVGLGKVMVSSFGGLLVDFAATRGAAVLLRGLRSAVEFESEEQMAALNRQLHPEMETVFLSAVGGNRVISSHMVKEIASLGGNVSPFVPAAVARRLQEKYPHAKLV